MTAILGLSPLLPTVYYRNIWRQKHLVWVTVILALSLLCPVGFPTKLCPPFPVPMPVCHAHHNLSHSSRKYLPPKNPWISIRPSSIAFSKTAPFVANTVGTSELTLLYNVFYPCFVYFLLLHVPFVSSIVSEESWKSESREKCRHFHCRKFAHCHLICLIVNIELRVPFLVFFSYYILFGMDTQISSSTILPISLSCHLTYNLNTHCCVCWNFLENNSRICSELLMLYILLYSLLSICKYHVRVHVGFSKKLIGITQTSDFKNYALFWSLCQVY